VQRDDGNDCMCRRAPAGGRDAHLRHRRASCRLDMHEASWLRNRRLHMRTGRGRCGSSFLLVRLLLFFASGSPKIDGNALFRTTLGIVRLLMLEYLPRNASIA